MDKKSVIRKSDFIIEIADKMELSNEKAKEVVESLFKGIIQSVKRGPVRIPGFGVFRTAHRSARKGRNPRTGEIIDIDSTTYPIFVPDEKLNALIEGRKKKSKI